jgi:uncharacterized damage-inducible protein DinB
MKMDVVNLTRMLIMERRFSSNIFNDIPPDRSEFRPVEGMMTAAEQLAHIGAFDEWLVQGLKHGNWGFDTFTDRPEKTVEEARAFLDHARRRLMALVEELKSEGINSPIGPNPIFSPEMHKANVLMMTNAHECHHRGQLVVYIRMMGFQPTMIYDLSNVKD